jgi:hypothetical protein
MFELEFTEDKKIKIIYRGDDPLEVRIILLLSTIRIPVSKITFNFQSKNHWFIPDLDYTGCSYLRLEWGNSHREYFLPKETQQNLNKKPHNVICLGLNKTGTTSLKSGLEDLGYDVMWEALGHQFISSDIWRGDYSSLNSIVQNPRFNAYEDIPFSLKETTKKIFEIDPTAKYILTIRDVNKWVKSVLNFYYPHFPYLNSFFNNPHDYNHNYGYVQNVHTRNWNKIIFDSWGLHTTENLEQQLENIYNSHVNEVIEFFKTNGGELLILDVSTPGSFKQMAEFLGEETDKTDFPWLNKSK